MSTTMSTIKSNITMFALELIARKSFSSCSYDEISRAFSITKAAVHYHFKTKEDLGVAICNTCRDMILEAQPEELEAARKGRHPWQYIEANYQRLSPNSICPIVSLQADFENIPERMRAALAQLTITELENFRLLTQAYNSKVNAEAIIPLIFSVKGALQYRRVMGEKFFKKTVKSIKAQFYTTIFKPLQ